MAATRIPWTTVIENSPVLVDMMARARERFMTAGTHDFPEELRVLQEENIRLANSLLQTTERLAEVNRMLEVVIARQRTLALVSILALLAAVASLGLWLVK